VVGPRRGAGWHPVHPKAQLRRGSPAVEARSADLFAIAVAFGQRQARKWRVQLSSPLARQPILLREEHKVNIGFSAAIMEG